MMTEVESNDSPEIPDRGETSDIPSLPFGGGGGTGVLKAKYLSLTETLSFGQKVFSTCLTNCGFQDKTLIIPKRKKKQKKNTWVVLLRKIFPS